MIVLPEVRERLDAALTEVTAAEVALEALLKELRIGTRAEKVTVTAAVANAFTRLREGRADLARLKELLDPSAAEDDVDTHAGT